MPLPRLEAQRRSGEEAFHRAGTPLDFHLLQFWQWSASDLASNALRGVLAEFLVARALGIGADVRAEWDAYDLRTPEGITVEVKSAAYLQVWHQERLSRITFDIRPTRGWNARTGCFAPEPSRQADLYVFALLLHDDKPSLDPLDLAQWTFFVLGTPVLNEKLPTQQRLSLSSLMKLRPEQCGFDDLRAAVDRIASPGR